MIQLTLTDLDLYYYIKAEGHSNQSIVCASVSILLETWRLAEESLEQQKILYENGLIEASIPKSMIAQILFTHLCIGLTAIQKKYPSDISLNIGG
ncbi:MAG: ribosomal-processing cysteine protease Prp [Brevinema sp.]